MPGSLFWRSSRKIIVANSTETVHLSKGGKNRKRANTHDVLEQLRKIVSGDEQPPASQTSRPAPEEEAKRQLSAIFQCSICLSTATLPAAVCSRCYAVIGCVPCIEQWYESSNGTTKCPLCRTKKDYALLPMVRDIANILGQAIEEAEDQNDSDSTTNTIAYGMDDSGDDDDLPPAFT